MWWSLPRRRWRSSRNGATLTHIGQTMRFTATQTGDAGTGGAAMLLWESRDTAVFTVDASGLVTARGNGTAQLVASVGRLWDLAIVRVAQEAAVLEPFGQGQQVLAGLTPPKPVGVRLADAGGTPVAGTLVRFEAVVGGGTADPGAVFSDSAGVASAVWTLGRGAYGGQRLAVWVEDGPRAEIEVTALGPGRGGRPDRSVLGRGPVGAGRGAVAGAGCGEGAGGSAPRGGGRDGAVRGRRRGAGARRRRRR